MHKRRSYKLHSRVVNYKKSITNVSNYILRTDYSVHMDYILRCAARRAFSEASPDLRKLPGGILKLKSLTQLGRPPNSWKFDLKTGTHIGATLGVTCLYTLFEPGAEY